MQHSSLLDFLPLWCVFVLTLAISAGAMAGGYRLGKYRRGIAEPENEDPVSAIVSATLGLLGFIMAFTFGMAASRYDERRVIVMEEANAIGTAYLRAELLNEPHRTATRKLLREYVDVRLAAADHGNIDQALARSADIQNILWAHAVAVAKKEPDSIIVDLFVESVNDVFDIHSKRVMFGLRSRIPGAIWLTLDLVSGLGMFLLGYYEGLVSKRRSPAMLGLVVTFSVVMLLIADLDRSREGWLQISQQAMLDLKSSFDVPSARIE